MFGMAQQAEIRGRRAIDIDVVAGSEGFERLLRAFRAEILRDRGEQILHRHRGAPAPEIRRDRRQFVRHKQIGLNPFDRCRLAQ